ncbi:hypothetical protein MMC07_008040 [Pseudocyphellaria aurata]|nr:hypothetical protein [Pseudocyphellaria aurata]
MTAETTFGKAASFLAPVLQRESIVKARGQSIIQCLDAGADTKDGTIPELRRKIIEKALALLLEIHACLSQKAETSDSPNSLQSPSQQKTVDGLLDLISLEGIYPFLSPGVGVPIERRVRSVLRGGIVSKPSPAGDGAVQKDKSLLAEICDGLYGITKNEGTGLTASLQERTLVDLIAGLGELAYAPLSDDQDSKRQCDCMLRSLLDSTPTRVLFPVLTSLLQPATPEWFRAHVSTHLSMLPLRLGGIKHTINFIASSAPPEFQDPSARSNDRPDQPHSPGLSLEVITQASRLLSSVPSSMTAETYFLALAPELLQLLSDPNPDTQRASAYIIGNGILGRRKYGSPGTVGWRIFAEPIIQSLNPVKTEQGAVPKPTSNVDKNGLRPVVVAEDKIRSALQQLTSLVLLHPNPGLTKRLISPCLRSLWGLLCYSKESNRSGWVDKIHQILCTYIKTSVGVDKLMILSDELLWDGESTWTYGPGPSGGIEIQQRHEDSFQRPDMIAMMQNIDSRVDELVRLLKSGVADDDEIGSLFVHVSKHWLLDCDNAKGTNRLEPGDDGGKDPLQSLVYAKLTQKMLEEYKDTLAATPKRIIELVHQLLSAYNVEHEEIRTRSARASTPSLAGLGTIVNANLAIGDADAPERPRDEDSTEMISVALSLLVAFLSSPEFALDPETSRLLDSLRKSLAHINTPNRSFPTSISMTASNILALVDLHLSLLPNSLDFDKKRPPDPHADDRKAHQQALTYLTDPLPPIRAQGISLLTSLITKPSPTLDIPSTTILLQSLLQDDDEFIYLSAIKALGQLASRHPKAVVKRLVEQYVDVAEDAGLDVRIRTGEALLKAVESLGSGLAGDVAKTVGEGMIAVAGRRGKKTKARESRRKQRQQAEQSKKEADEAWGGEAPNLSDLGHLDAERNTAAAAADEEEDEKLLHAWKSPRGDDGDEDDTRMRASALSILGAAIESHLAGLGHRLVCTALDLVVATLRFEPGGAGRADTAILRRAAVLLVLSLLRALDGDAAANKEAMRELSFGLLLGPEAEELHNVLRQLESQERDVIVLGHVRTVLDRLESFRTRVLLGQDREGRAWAPGAEGALGFEVDEVKGLAVNARPFEKEGSRPKPIIEEIE